MPFDTSTFPQAKQAADPTALYRERRERAAALWATGTTRPFNIKKWVCGTTVCAIGDLAVRGHDGWGWEDGAPERSGKIGFDAICNYFGLSNIDAVRCFADGGCSMEFYRKSPDTITIADVSAKLLALPYTLPAERV